MGRKSNFLSHTQKKKRAFCSTPVKTLSIQAGIQDFLLIRDKAALIRYAKSSSLNNHEGLVVNPNVDIVKKGLVLMSLFSQEDEDEPVFSEVEKCCNLISPQKDISSQVFLQYFQEKEGRH